MTVQHDHTARPGRLALITAAVGGFFAGTSRAVAVWLISLLTEED